MFKVVFTYDLIDDLKRRELDVKALQKTAEEELANYDIIPNIDEINIYIPYEDSTCILMSYSTDDEIIVTDIISFVF